MKSLLDGTTEWKYNADEVDADSISSIWEDDRVSFKAKGVWGYMMGKGKGWDFCADRIAKDSMDGRKSVLSAIKELESVGYLSRSKLGNGRVVYQLYKTPVLNFSDSECKSMLLDAFPDSMKPAVVEFRMITFDDARQAISAHVADQAEACFEADQFRTACAGARISMNERTLDTWIGHIKAS